LIALSCVEVRIDIISEDQVNKKDGFREECWVEFFPHFRAIVDVSIGPASSWRFGGECCARFPLMVSSGARVEE